MAGMLGLDWLDKTDDELVAESDARLERMVADTIIDIKTGMRKVSFASRSEAGRYAANQRWKDHTKEDDSGGLDGSGDEGQDFQHDGAGVVYTDTVRGEEGSPIRELAFPTDMRIAELMPQIDDLRQQKRRIREKIVNELAPEPSLRDLERAIGWAKTKEEEALLQQKYDEKLVAFDRTNYVVGNLLGGLVVGQLPEAVQAKLDDQTWTQRNLAEGTAKYTEINGKLAPLVKEELALEAIYEENGWSRFYLVEETNGHIHSNMDCQSCNRIIGGKPTRTSFSWLPSLSGLTQGDAVAQEGSILCTHCFPDAPVGWTNGTSNRTTEAKAGRAEAKAVRDSVRNAKALTTHGTEHVFNFRTSLARPDESYDRDRVSTLHQARILLTDQTPRHFTGRNIADSMHPDAVRLAGLVADKEGKTVEQVLGEARERGLQRDKRRSYGG